jgi:3-oxoadipate enol-lactonase
VGDERRPDHPWSATTGIAEVNGAKLYYEMLGTGHPLVLIHAESLDRRMWEDQFTAFAERYQVIRYDLPGYGKSQKVAERRLGADTLLGLLKYLEIEKAYLLGSSGGGAIALDFTLDHPCAVDALILAAPGLGGYMPVNFVEFLQHHISPLLPVWQEAVQTRDISRLVDLMMKDSSVASVHGAVRERLQNILMENAHAFLDPPMLGIRRDPAASQGLPEIRAATLVIVGGQDSSDAQEIANLLEMGVPSARKVVIPGAYHMVNMEQPEEFNRVVLDFLSQV